MEEGKGSHSYIVPLQLEDEVLVLVAWVMLHVCGQQQSLVKAFCNLTPQGAPSSSDKWVVGEGLVTHHEGALPSRGRGHGCGGHIRPNVHRLIGRSYLGGEYP